MRHWLVGICLGLYAIVCQAAILDDPIEVTVGSESDHVVLRVGVDNDPAVRLYERVGFEVVDSFLTSLGADAP